VKVIAFLSQKGGAGKSTLARQLAVIAGEAGPAFLVDRDPQATTSKWWGRRTEQEPAPRWPELMDLGEVPLADAVARLRPRSGVLFIDTAPAVGVREAEVAQVADLVIVPVRPSPDDLEAVGDTLRIIRRLGRPAVLVVNAAKNLSRSIGAQAALARYPFAVCPTALADRAAYLDAALEGRGVGELKGAGARDARAEIQAVWKWIGEQMEAEQ
jgi:chromosome partitioning protein